MGLHGAEGYYVSQLLKPRSASKSVSLADRSLQVSCIPLSETI